MKKIGPRLRILILAVVLLIISFGMIVIFGNKYTVKIKNVNLDSVDDLIINYSDTYGNDMTDKVVRCINKEIKGDNLILTFESVSEGKVFVDVCKANSELLKYVDLAEKDYAFEIDYELKPADEKYVPDLTEELGEYDEESGWIKNCHGFGVMRYNEIDDKYDATSITDVEKYK